MSETKPETKEDTKSEEEYIDPWKPEERKLIDEMVSTSEAELCEKISTYPTMIISSDRYYEFMQKVRTEYKFDMLKSHTCVDWLEDNQFEIISLFFSTAHLQHFWISTSISREKPEIETLAELWPIAEFQEREVYDLFGVLYKGHTDLRRIFLDDDWDGFPLRKDYQDEFMLEKP